MQNRDIPPPELSDETLVDQVVQRNRSAFSLLYDRYARAVYVMAAYMLGPAEADEVMQEVFVRLWNKAHQFDPARGSFAAWFMTIVRNHVKDRLRSRSQQARILAAEEISQLLAETVDPHANVEEEAWQRERGELMLRALKSLPEEQRLALILAYFGGLSQSSIAEHLNWPLGTVKKRMRLGLQKLRVFLNGKGLTVETEAEHTEASET
jgi:RNA polymerase sigma-70 factor (ECF subfamily)